MKERERKEFALDPLYGKGERLKLRRVSKEDCTIGTYLLINHLKYFQLHFSTRLLFF